MTCCIAVADPEHSRILFAVDSGTWNGHEVAVLKIPKVWQSSGFVFAMAGHNTLIAAMRAVDLSTDEGIRDDAAYVHDVIAPRFFNAAAVRATTLKNADMGDDLGYDVMVARGPRLWFIPNGCADEIDLQYRAVHGIGLGADYAVGAALAVQHSMTPLNAAAHAMRVTAHCSSAVHPPFRYFWSDGTIAEPCPTSPGSALVTPSERSTS